MADREDWNDRQTDVDHDNVVTLLVEVRQLKENLAAANAEIATIKKTINRGMGGMSVILGGSALIGWVTSHMDIARLFK